MGKWKRALGISAWLGNERKLDELEGELKLAKQAVKHHIRDWQEQEKMIPVFERKIAETKKAIAKERAED